MSTRKVQPGSGLTRRQIFWERMWASTILLYTIVATLIVWKTLSKYGVNVLVFFIIDAVTSWTYGIATARLLLSVIKGEWKIVRKWSLAAALSFITPQVYILASARHAPRDVYLIVIVVIALLILFAVATLLLQIRKSKQVERPLVLIAPDKFKGTLSAREVADALGRGLSPRVNVRKVPLADGGEGSIDAITSAGFEVLSLDPSIPSALSRPAHIARKDDLFFIEAAEFCGLRYLTGEPDPMGANTLGVGYAVLAAMDLGAKKIVLGVGGTSSTDGGSGFLIGLGARFLDGTGAPIASGGGGLTSLAEVDLSSLDPRLKEVEIILASDVDTPFLGSMGSARLFAPQKGASTNQVEILEMCLTRLVSILENQENVWSGRARSASLAAGSGAGGGLGFAALLLGATRVPGADYILDLLSMDDLLSQSILVVTGEGALDKQSMAGKLPVALAARARIRGIPVAAVVGTSQLTEEDALLAGFTHLYALDQIDPHCATDRELSIRLLTQIGRTMALPHLTT